LSLVTGFWSTIFSHRLLNNRHWQIYFINWLSAFGTLNERNKKKQKISNRELKPETRCRRPGVRNQLPATSNQEPATSNRDKTQHALDDGLIKEITITQPDL
jgi:hypothetical protein